jgi:tetratricopeptide (TPR) repeat protein
MQHWPTACSSKSPPEIMLTAVAICSWRSRFFSATQAHPDSAAAFNNLAQTLSDLGKHEAALQAIQRALHIGGPLEENVRKTLAEIEQKKRAAREGALQ